MPNHGTPIVLWPDEVLTFSIATILFGIEIEILQIADICTENDMNQNSDIGNSTDERTVDFEWAIYNKHNQLHCRFQITYTQLFHGIKNPFDCFIWTRSL